MKHTIAILLFTASALVNAQPVSRGANSPNISQVGSGNVSVVYGGSDASITQVNRQVATGKYKNPNVTTMINVPLGGATLTVNGKSVSIDALGVVRVNGVEVE